MSAARPFTIRACEPPEAGRLAALAARLFAQAYGATHPEPTLGAYLAEAFDPERLRAELATPGVRVLLAADDSRRPIGYAYLRESTERVPSGVPGARPAEVARFYVDAAWHGRGVAAALMAACEAEALRRGADALWLSVWQRAARPIAFYRRAGFGVVGTTTFRFGERLDDDYVMARRLPTPPAG
ncbi:MAG: GNAT family N-acetyltransferase [Gemmatimonadaceae bacterium]